MTVHAYVRASTNKQRDSPDIQKESIRQYCQANGLGRGAEIGHEPGPGWPKAVFIEPLWYIDAATSGKTLLREREAGSVLCMSLRRGDHVIIAKLDRAFRRLSDCVVAMDHFERVGVHLHVCNLLGGAIDLSQPIGRFLIHVLGAFAELERAFIAERVGEATRARKAKGLAAGCPHYGFKHEARFETRNGVKRRYLVEVPDPEERRVMKLILGLRMQDPPWSWDQIRQKIDYELKIRTRDGREWGEGRVKRACKAEAILQYKEAMSGRRCE